MEELLNQVAEIRGMPASLVRRSAEARAEKEGMTLEAVLAEWAGVELPEAADDDGIDDASDQTESTPEVATDAASAANADAGKGDVTTDDLVKLAAEAKRMPPKLILSSAKARAEHSGASLESVLAGWAAVDLDELRQSDSGSPSPVAVGVPAETPEPSGETPHGDEEADNQEADDEGSDAPAVAATVVATIGMDEILEKVAAAKGMPEALAKRSAEARAKKTGEPLAAVLAEWAGVDPAKVEGAIPATEATEVVEAPAEDAAATTAEADETTIDAEDRTEAQGDGEPGVTKTKDVEVIEAAATDDAAPEVPTRMGGYPRWLTAAFVIIPLLAVAYILVSPNGPDCGTGAQLLVDPVTGTAVNCDGSAYGTEATDYFGNGAALYAQCQACHAADGSGGAGPAFTGGDLLTVFPAGSCSTQIEWVTLGTSGWPDPTYGATSKPVGGVGLMPAFGPTLTPDQIAEVVLYERVQFGGQDLTAAEEDCGFTGGEGGADTTTVG